MVNFNINLVASVCHNVNKVICDYLGDTSQVTFDIAEEWQKESAIKGVQFLLDNTDATPEMQHESWVQAKLDDGWKYGVVKDANLKTHPCIVPYNQLPKEQQLKDYAFQAVVESFL